MYICRTLTGELFQVAANRSTNEPDDIEDGDDEDDAMQVDDSVEASEPPPPPSPPPPPPLLNASGVPARPTRNAGLPRRYRDLLPEAPPIVETVPVQNPVRRVVLIVRDQLATSLNPFRIWRAYMHRPTYDPDASVPLDDLSSRFRRLRPDNDVAAQPEPKDTQYAPPWPFRSMTVYRLMSWLNTGSGSKSEAEADRLVDEVVMADDFVPEDLRGFSANRENRRLDQAKQNESDSPLEGFKEASVNIEVPSGSSDIPSKMFAVPGLFHRDLLDVIRTAFADPLASKYHLSPFKLFHNPAGTNEQHRVYGELYTSDAFINEHDRVQRLPPPPDNPSCKLERVIAGLMAWSDSTHLANFGNAKLWPIYILLGNLSKYYRAQPNSGACHHLAYIPSVRIHLTRLVSC